MNFQIETMNYIVGWYANITRFFPKINNKYLFLINKKISV